METTIGVDIQEWFDQAEQNFEEAVESLDWATAHFIVSDVNSKGFKTESNTLLQKLTLAKTDNMAMHA